MIHHLVGSVVWTLNLFSILFCGCIPPQNLREMNNLEHDVAELTMINWRAHVGPMRIGCRELILDIPIYEARTQEEFFEVSGGFCGPTHLPGEPGEPCNTTPHYSGRIFINKFIGHPFVILTATGNGVPVISHEVIHALGYCNLGDSDPEHEQYYWDLVTVRSIECRPEYPCWDK